MNSLVHYKRYIFTDSKKIKIIETLHPIYSNPDSSVYTDELGFYDKLEIYSIRKAELSGIRDMYYIYLNNKDYLLENFVIDDKILIEISEYRNMQINEILNG